MMTTATLQRSSVVVVVFSTTLLFHESLSTIAVIAATDCGEIVAPNRTIISAIRILG